MSIQRDPELSNVFKEDIFVANKHKHCKYYKKYCCHYNYHQSSNKFESKPEDVKPQETNNSLKKIPKDIFADFDFNDFAKIKKYKTSNVCKSIFFDMTNNDNKKNAKNYCQSKCKMCKRRMTAKRTPKDISKQSCLDEKLSENQFCDKTRTNKELLIRQKEKIHIINETNLGNTKDTTELVKKLQFQIPDSEKYHEMNLSNLNNLSDHNFETNSFSSYPVLSSLLEFDNSTMNDAANVSPKVNKHTKTTCQRLKMIFNNECQQLFEEITTLMQIITNKNTEKFIDSRIESFLPQQTFIRDDSVIESTQSHEADDTYTDTPFSEAEVDYCDLNKSRIIQTQSNINEKKQESLQDFEINDSSLKRASHEINKDSMIPNRRPLEMGKILSLPRQSFMKEYSTIKSTKSHETDDTYTYQTFSKAEIDYSDSNKSQIIKTHSNINEKKQECLQDFKINDSRLKKESHEINNYSMIPLLLETGNILNRLKENSSAESFNESCACLNEFIDELSNSKEKLEKTNNNIEDFKECCNNSVCHNHKLDFIESEVRLCTVDLQNCPSLNNVSSDGNSHISAEKSSKENENHVRVEINKNFALDDQTIIYISQLMNDKSEGQLENQLPGVPDILNCFEVSSVIVLKSLPDQKHVRCTPLKSTDDVLLTKEKTYYPYSMISNSNFKVGNQSDQPEHTNDTNDELESLDDDKKTDWGGHFEDKIKWDDIDLWCNERQEFRFESNSITSGDSETNTGNETTKQCKITFNDLDAETNTQSRMSQDQNIDNGDQKQSVDVTVKLNQGRGIKTRNSRESLNLSVRNIPKKCPSFGQNTPESDTKTNCNQVNKFGFTHLTVKTPVSGGEIPDYRYEKMEKATETSQNDDDKFFISQAKVKRLVNKSVQVEYINDTNYVLKPSGVKRRKNLGYSSDNRIKLVAIHNWCIKKDGIEIDSNSYTTGDSETETENESTRQCKYILNDFDEYQTNIESGTEIENQASQSTIIDQESGIQISRDSPDSLDQANRNFPKIYRQNYDSSSLGQDTSDSDTVTKSNEAHNLDFIHPDAKILISRGEISGHGNEKVEVANNSSESDKFIIFKEKKKKKPRTYNLRHKIKPKKKMRIIKAPRVKIYLYKVVNDINDEEGTIDWDDDDDEVQLYEHSENISESTNNSINTSISTILSSVYDFSEHSDDDWNIVPEDFAQKLFNSEIDTSSESIPTKKHNFNKYEDNLWTNEKKMSIMIENLNEISDLDSNSLHTPSEPVFNEFSILTFCKQNSRLEVDDPLLDVVESNQHIALDMFFNDLKMLTDNESKYELDEYRFAEINTQIMKIMTEIPACYYPQFDLNEKRQLRNQQEDLPSRKTLEKKNFKRQAKVAKSSEINNDLSISNTSLQETGINFIKQNENFLKDSFASFNEFDTEQESFPFSSESRNPKFVYNVSSGSASNNLKEKKSVRIVSDKVEYFDDSKGNTGKYKKMKYASFLFSLYPKQLSIQKFCGSCRKENPCEKKKPKPDIQNLIDELRNHPSFKDVLDSQTSIKEQPEGSEVSAVSDRPKREAEPPDDEAPKMNAEYLDPNTKPPPLEIYLPNDSVALNGHKLSSVIVLKISPDGKQISYKQIKTSDGVPLTNEYIKTLCSDPSKFDFKVINIPNQLDHNNNDMTPIESECRKDMGCGTMEVEKHRSKRDIGGSVDCFECEDCIEANRKLKNNFDLNNDASKMDLHRKRCRKCHKRRKIQHVLEDEIDSDCCREDVVKTRHKRETGKNAIYRKTSKAARSHSSEDEDYKLVIYKTKTTRVKGKNPLEKKIFYRIIDDSISDEEQSYKDYKEQSSKRNKREVEKRSKINPKHILKKEYVYKIIDDFNSDEEVRLDGDYDKQFFRKNKSKKKQIKNPSSSSASTTESYEFEFYG